MGIFIEWKYGYCIFIIYWVLMSNKESSINWNAAIDLKLKSRFSKSLFRYIRIIWKYHWSYHHKLPNRVKSVYFVDNKGHFEQMINGRISFMLSHSITWSLCTIKTTFHSLSFCFLTTKKEFLALFHALSVLCCPLLSIEA